MTFKLLSGKVIRKDAVDTVNKVAVIIKPNTESGIKAAEKRAGIVVDELGHTPEVVLYDPTNPAYLKDSPTYIGPKKK